MSPLPSVGSYLRDLREARGVSLEELARVTRVGTGYLRALEADDHARLPAAVFTRGFIRAYCQVLGASPDEALAAYRAAAPDGESPEPVTVPAGRRRARAGRRGPVVVSAALVVVLGVGLALVSGMLRRGGEGRVAGPGAPAPAAAPVAPPPGPVATAPAPPPAAPAPAPVAAPAPAPAYRLVARASEATWVRVRREDGPMVEETIQAGETREWRSGAPIVLTVGNAGGIALELNGEALPPLGTRGTVVRDVVLPAPAR